MASLPRVVTPTDLRVAPLAAGRAGPAPAAGDGPPVLEARFSIETYVIPTAALSDATPG